MSVHVKHTQTLSRDDVRVLDCLIESCGRSGECYRVETPPVFLLDRVALYIVPLGKDLDIEFERQIKKVKSTNFPITDTKSRPLTIGRKAEEK